MGISSTPIEGVDVNLIGELFNEELDGHFCTVALAIVYSKAEKDDNYG